VPKHRLFPLTFGIVGLGNVPTADFSLTGEQALPRAKRHDDKTIVAISPSSGEGSWFERVDRR
jgi:hypothetical protein